MLAWNANGETDLAGYKVYYGTAPGTYGTPISLGNVTTYTLSGLIGGQTYYISITAYDTSNNESGHSNEVNGVPGAAPPVITSFSINNGAASTANAVVTLNNVATNSPTQYMASESSSFTGASWQTYSTAPSFTLSSGSGIKRVYLKVKNSSGESSVVNDTITALAPTVTLFRINNGASSTANAVVTLNNTATNSPAQYMASESSSFTGASWQTYSTAPSFTLSSGSGTKRVYFKVKNSFAESPVVNDTITALAPDSDLIYDQQWGAEHDKRGGDAQQCGDEQPNAIYGK